MDQKVLLLTKGADSIILKRTRKTSLEDKNATERTIELLRQYSEIGLRTLMLAKRELT